MTPTADIRWKQRYQSFDRAFVLLRDAMAGGPARLTALEKEGVIQRFEYSFELAWKTLKDYLEYSGLEFATVTARHVLKEAFVAKIIADGQVWIDMLEHRNEMSHTYSLASFEIAVEAIDKRYLPAFEQVHSFLHAEHAK